MRRHRKAQSVAHAGDKMGPEAERQVIGNLARTDDVRLHRSLPRQDGRVRTSLADFPEREWRNRLINNEGFNGLEQIGDSVLASKPFLMKEESLKIWNMGSRRRSVHRGWQERVELWNPTAPCRHCVEDTGKGRSHQSRVCHKTAGNLEIW